jgi:hypothetical protein
MLLQYGSPELTDFQKRLITTHFPVNLKELEEIRIPGPRLRLCFAERKRDQFCSRRDL